MRKASLEQMNCFGLEEAASKRKERLQNLQCKAEESTNRGNNTYEYSACDEKSIPKPIFRNYIPQDQTIQKIPIKTLAEPGDIESEVKIQLELMKTPIVIDEIDIVNLAPRKPDWDLKRDVSKKLGKLEKRTQRAIGELIRDRLKRNQENILAFVNVSSAITMSESLNTEK